MIGDAVGAAITTAVHIFFWTTLAFAAIERTQACAGRRPDRGRPPAARAAPAGGPGSAS